MDAISYYRLRKLASMSDLDKGAIIGSTSTVGSLLGGFGMEYAALKNKRFQAMLERRIKKALLAGMQGNKLKAFGHAALAGLVSGVPAGVGTTLGMGLGAGIPAKLMDVKSPR